MFTTLSNELISIQVNDKGAELSNLKKQGEAYEYMWQGDRTFWTGRSPVLFPIVGSLKNGVTRIEGQEYCMGNHGFARMSIFNLLEKTKDTLTYSLMFSEETLKLYPYKFELLLKYTLKGSSIAIDYTVKNLDNRTIYFQLGTHPAFNCPTSDIYDLSDYKLSFNQEENVQREGITSENMLVPFEGEKLIGKTLSLNKELFLKSACIYRKIQSDSITLESDKDPRKVKVSYEKFPFLGIWQPPNAPFVCIEPWHGITESETASGEFIDKEKIIKLPIEAEHTCHISIEV